MARVQLEELLAGLVLEWRAIAARSGRAQDTMRTSFGEGVSVGAASAYQDCAKQLERILPREEVEVQRGNAGITRSRGNTE